MQKLCRWGILGAATIAQKNWAAIWNSGTGTLVAVASRDPSRAQAYIQTLQQECPFPEIPRACTYDELLACKEIDAVYIPLPTALRAQWVIRAAQAGKHVLCEKPCALNAGQLQEMIHVCNQHGVQFMDGVMFMHSQRMHRLREVLDEETNIGQIKRIAGQFSFRAPDQFLANDIRMSSQLEPHGCLGDLGWYLIRFAIWVMGSKLPVQVSSRILSQQSRSDSPHAVPTEATVDLLFEGGVSAGFYCSFLTENQQFAHVSGTRGNLLLNDFVLPYYGSEVAFHVANDHYQVAGTQFNMENHVRRVSVREYSNNASNAQETNLFRNFAEIVLSGKVDPYWPEISLKTQVVLDACLESARQNAELVTISQ